MNKTSAATLAGRTLSLIPTVQGISDRSGDTLQAQRTEQTAGGPRAPTDTMAGLSLRWSVGYEAPIHVARDRVAYRLQDFMPHVEDLSTSLSRLMVARHGPGFRENCELIAAYARTTRWLAIRDQLTLLANFRNVGEFRQSDSLGRQTPIPPLWRKTLCAMKVRGNCNGHSF